MINFKAKVIPGSGRGKRLGFPTANLDKIDLNLAHGVYLVKAKLDDKIYQGLLHYGPKETFNEAVSCEVYLNNFHKNIYGRSLEVEVSRKIRQVRKFAGAAALKKQIAKDLMELKQGN